MDDQDEMETVLILGATGRFGRAAAAAFRAEGWRVRVWLRPGGAAHEGCEAWRGEIHDAAALAAASRGADVIVNALNPPYPAWAEEVPRMTAAVIGAAKAAGATVLIPGNVYNYGAHLPPLLTETTPEIGDHRKAAIRIAMEAAYRRAGVKTIVLRAGDFIDTAPGDNWFEGHVAAKAAKGMVVYPGPADVAHAWAFLPDYARAAVALAAKRRALAKFEAVGFPGFTLTGDELIAAMERAAGPLSRKTFPWWALGLIAPFSPLMREVLAVRYLWRRPHAIDGARFAGLAPEFKATGVDEAIASSLRGAGLLAPADASVIPARSSA